MNIQARNDRILVRAMPDAMSTIIECPKDTKSQLLKGEVLSAGPKASVCKGECVLFTQACKTMERDGTMWIRDADLVGTIEPDAKVLHGESPYFEG